MCRRRILVLCLRVGQEHYVKRKKTCALFVYWAGTLCEEAEGVLCLFVGQERYV